jgi:DNA-binding MarR family transcriptional regulator
MLKQAFAEVYIKFKLHFYQETFGRTHTHKVSLTTVETFCMEAVQALHNPTVNEFAAFMQISPPNAAYKVNNLIQKGYLRKVRSEQDHREYHLEPTQQYLDYYNVSSIYMDEVMERIATRFSSEDCQKLAEILTVMSNELMPEIELPDTAETEH